MSTLIKQTTKDNIKNTFNESALILVYEFLGTFMMGTLFINYCKSPLHTYTTLSP